MFFIFPSPLAGEGPGERVLFAGAGDGQQLADGLQLLGEKNVTTVPNWAPWAVGLGLGFSGLVGVAAGFLPAVKAAKP